MICLSKRLKLTQKCLSNLRKLDYSPTINPLMEPQQVTSKRRFVRSGHAEELINPRTGEVHGVATIHQVEERDDAEFVKVFAAGVAASYELTKTAQRMFQVVLDQYQRTPMSRGFADHVNLFWFDDGIEGIEHVRKTFQRGLKELLAKRFIYPKGPSRLDQSSPFSSKGDRILFVKEYRRRKTSHQEELEARGQQRLEVGQ